MNEYQNQAIKAEEEARKPELKKIPLPEAVVPWKGFLKIASGGLDPENLLYRLSNEMNLFLTNGIVYSMAIQIYAQVNLIERLVEAGKLPKTQMNNDLSWIEDEKETSDMGAYHRRRAYGPKAEGWTLVFGEREGRKVVRVDGGNPTYADIRNEAKARGLSGVTLLVEL